MIQRHVHEYIYYTSTLTRGSWILIPRMHVIRARAKRIIFVIRRQNVAPFVKRATCMRLLEYFYWTYTPGLSLS
jgi:hypothetical protein